MSEVVQYDEIEQYNETLERDADAFESFIDNIYSKKVAQPEPAKTSFWSIVGIETSLYTISAIGAAILSSVRTGGLFYILEQVLLAEYSLGGVITNGLSLTSLVTSLLAFEGFLLAVGFSNGKHKKNITVSKWGIVVAFVVVMGAGIFSGLGIVDMNDQMGNIMNIALALITGVGASIITFYGGENIGYAFQLYDEKKKELVYYNQEEYNDWRDSAQKMYNASRYNINSKRYKDTMKEIQQQREANEIVEKFVAVEDVSEVVEEKKDEVVKYHYLRNVKNGLTLDQKYSLYNDGHAGLRNMFPGIPDTQVARWNKNLERDLIEAGVLENKSDTKQEYYEKDFEDDEWDN